MSTMFSSSSSSGGGVRLSPSEVKYERDGIQLGVRRDGRSLLDSRHINLQVGILPQANGSARVRTMLAESDVLCGVKFEVGSAEDSAVQCSVDLGAIARADLFGPAEAQKRAERRGLELADQLVAQFACGVASALPPPLVPGKAKWICYLDLVVLADGGNLADYLALACYAALSNARVPATVRHEEEDDFDINPDFSAAERFATASLTMAVTCWVVNDRVVCDPSPQEEACADCAFACCVARGGGGVTRMVKLGSGRVDAALVVSQVVGAATLHAKQLFQFLDKEIAAQEAAAVAKKKSSSGGAGGGVCLTRALYV